MNSKKMSRAAGYRAHFNYLYSIWEFTESCDFRRVMDPLCSLIQVLQNYKLLISLSAYVELRINSRKASRAATYKAHFNYLY